MLDNSNLEVLIITCKRGLVHNGHNQHNHKSNISTMIQKNDIPGIDCLELFRVFEHIDILDNWNERTQFILGF